MINDAADINWVYQFMTVANDNYCERDLAILARVFEANTDGIPDFEGVF